MSERRWRGWREGDRKRERERAINTRNISSQSVFYSRGTYELPMVAWQEEGTDECT